MKKLDGDMLYVRLEKWPEGDRERREVLGEATVSCMTGAEEEADYEFLISNPGGFDKLPSPDPHGPSVDARGHVYNFLKGRGAWDLLHMALGLFLSRNRARARHGR